MFKNQDKYKMDQKPILMSASRAIRCDHTRDIRLVGSPANHEILDNVHTCDYQQLRIDLHNNQQFSVPHNNAYPSTIFTTATCNAMVADGDTNGIYDEMLAHNFTTSQLQMACHTGGKCIEDASNELEAILKKGDAMYQQAVRDAAHVNHVACYRKGRVHIVPIKRLKADILGQVTQDQSPSSIVVTIISIIGPLLITLAVFAYARRPRTLSSLLDKLRWFRRSQYASVSSVATLNGGDACRQLVDVVLTARETEDMQAPLLQQDDTCEI